MEGDMQMDAGLNGEPRSRITPASADGAGLNGNGLTLPCTCSELTVRCR